MIYRDLLPVDQKYLLLWGIMINPDIDHHPYLQTKPPTETWSYAYEYGDIWLFWLVPNQVPCDVGKIVYRGIYYGPLVLVMMILLVYYCTNLSATGGILDSQGMMVDNNTMERIFAL